MSATTPKWTDRLRWRIAEVLNRLPGSCWADLVSWALGDRPLFGEDGALGGASGCRDAAAERGTCYCAKFRTAECEREFRLGAGVVVPPSLPPRTPPTTCGECGDDLAPGQRGWHGECFRLQDGA